jgi:CPA2 family monovalent cation:H+ antiporter-2
VDGILLLAVIFLVAGVIAVPIASRLGLGSVLGYLIAGIAISPLLHQLHVDVVSIQHFAEFGVVMMLFLVGLELEPRLLWAMRDRLLGLGGLQVTVTAAAIMGIAMLFGQPWSIALAVGLVLSLSSTAIVLQTLNEKGLMKCDGGQSSFSVRRHPDARIYSVIGIAGDGGRGNRRRTRWRRVGSWQHEPRRSPGKLAASAGHGRRDRSRRSRRDLPDTTGISFHRNGALA